MGMSATMPIAGLSASCSSSQKPGLFFTALYPGWAEKTRCGRRLGCSEKKE